MNPFESKLMSKTIFETLKLRLVGQMKLSSLIKDFEEDTEDDIEDLYSVFYAIAAYLGFGHESARGGDAQVPRMWHMNYAEISSPHSDSTTEVEFQVGLIDCPNLVVPQFFKCAEMSLSRLGIFQPDLVELTYSPGKAKYMENRLFLGNWLLPMYDSLNCTRSRMSLIWHSNIKMSYSDIIKKMPLWDDLPFVLTYMPKTSAARHEWFTPYRSSTGKQSASAMVDVPEFSFDCLGWLVSYIISSLASVGAEDIGIRLERVTILDNITK